MEAFRRKAFLAKGSTKGLPPQEPAVVDRWNGRQSKTDTVDMRRYRIRDDMRRHENRVDICYIFVVQVLYNILLYKSQSHVFSRRSP